MLDNPIVIFDKAELGQRIVERAARGNQQGGYVQPFSALRGILFRHNPSPHRRVWTDSNP